MDSLLFDGRVCDKQAETVEEYGTVRKSRNTQGTVRWTIAASLLPRIVLWTDARYLVYFTDGKMSAKNT